MCHISLCPCFSLWHDKGVSGGGLLRCLHGSCDAPDTWPAILFYPRAFAPGNLKYLRRRNEGFLIRSLPPSRSYSPPRYQWYKAETVDIERIASDETWAFPPQCMVEHFRGAWRKVPPSWEQVRVYCAIITEVKPSPRSLDIVHEPQYVEYHLA